jgi:TolB-like protein
MSGFFEEVKRRKVYRVAVAYVVVAGGIIQLASAAFPAWELPNWALRLVIVVLLIGFPIALIFAWIFDITPAGIERTSRVAPQTMPKSHRRRNMWILAGTGIVVAAAAGFFLLPRASARKLDKSIAVLPFESFSDERDSAFFADGIQDDILTNLAKIGDLKVISRTSVAGYRGKPASVRDIGRALGVSYLLEGSVRKSQNRIRVNVQLINAANDQHLWAEDYDRDLNDVFAIQTDLAQKISNELQAKLSPREKAEMTRKPTENGEAYLAFIQAQNLFMPEELEKLKQAEQLYDRALQLDGNFAVAVANYSVLESWLYRNHDKAPARKQKALDLAHRAAQLQPDLPEAHWALGYCYYYGDFNLDAARQEFETAQRDLPNSADMALALGAIQRRQARWAESTANLEKAVELNPRDPWPLQNLAFNYVMLRRFDQAKQTVERGLQIQPRGFGLLEIKSKLAIAANGDVSVGQRILDEAKSWPLSDEERFRLIAGQADWLIYERKFRELLALVEPIPDQVPNSPNAGALKYFVLGVARKELGDEAGARSALLKAKELCQNQIKEQADVADLHAALAKVLAFLGEKEAALAEAQRAAELLPESKDAFDGPKITEQVAEVCAITGERDRAIDLLAGLLSRPSNVTVASLQISPIWDSLRNEARFQALLTNKSAKT